MLVLLNFFEESIEIYTLRSTLLNHIQYILLTLVVLGKHFLLQYLLQGHLQSPFTHFSGSTSFLVVFFFSFLWLLTFFILIFFNPIASYFLILFLFYLFFLRLCLRMWLKLASNSVSVSDGCLTCTSLLHQPHDC